MSKTALITGITGQDGAYLAELIKAIVGYRGKLYFDTSKPDRTPKKLLSVEKLNALGWKAGINLREGIADTYRWYLENH